MSQLILSLIVACTNPQVISTSPQTLLISRIDYNPSVIWTSRKNSTCPLCKLRTKITSPIAKSTSPGLLDMTFFARWLYFYENETIRANVWKLLKLGLISGLSVPWDWPSFKKRYRCIHLHSVFYKCTFETAEISTLVLWKRMTEYFFAKCLERKNKLFKLCQKSQGHSWRN